MTYTIEKESLNNSRISKSLTVMPIHAVSPAPSVPVFFFEANCHEKPANVMTKSTRMRVSTLSTLESDCRRV